MPNLLDSILTFIENYEAEQIQYGLYAPSLTGADILAAFNTNSTTEVCDTLNELWQQGMVIRFENNSDCRDWLFRSRMAETVRLVSKLRQRVVGSERERQIHHIDRCPQLVHDLKFEIRPRQVPDRNLPITDLIAPLRQRSAQNHSQVTDILTQLFPRQDFKFSGFQQRAFANIANHILLKPRRNDVRGVVVTASTGAGKTYAFFLPVLAYCLAEKGVRGQSGVKAICIYPRVALSENQLEDFVRLVYLANQHLPADKMITVGIDSGASPYQTSDFSRADDDSLQEKRGWRWDANHTRYICPFARCPVPTCNGELAVQQTQPDRIFCTSCGTDHPYILYAKSQFRTYPPDVLVATTESLNMRLMDSHYQMLFGNGDYPPPAVVMLDEIHLQSSTKGTQIAFLLRRLAARLQRGAEDHTSRPNLMLVGLSATIAEPKSFFSDLTGLTSSVISVVEPDEAQEMTIAGAERYLFVRAGQEEDTAVISTLLQTAMVIVHTLPHPSPTEQSSGIQKYKIFGFAQSLDILGRWFYQLTDAERMKEDNQRVRAGLSPQRWPIEHTPLFWYRVPGYNRRLFPNFFGRGTGQAACNCEQRGYPDLNCPYFQEGECWWAVLDGLTDPMQLKRKAASDRQVVITPEDDLIITTSALEVGYDDASIMGVIQYQSPTNVASFVQRKGRGGRSVGTRPIATTVFSPYKTSDVFLYQNHHLLVDPRFKKLPLNPHNLFLQRIHGFYALFDWLAFLAARRNCSLTFGTNMRNRDYATLKELTADTAILDTFRDYLADAFGIDNPARLQTLLVDPEAQRWNDRGILTKGLISLINELHDAYDGNGAPQSVNGREVLRDYLPKNLFSDINLPELDVIYGHRTQAQPEDIALGLAETIPGNVTFRGGGGSSWIAPPLGTGQVFHLEAAYSLSLDRRHELPIQQTDLPFRLRQSMNYRGRLPREFYAIRPVAVRMQKFGDKDSSQWWFNGSSEPGILLHAISGQATPQGQNINQVRHASSAYPLSFTQIDPLRTLGRRYAFDSRDEHIGLFNDVGRQLFNRIDFASDTDNGNLLKVRRVIVGSQYTLKLHNEDAPIEGVITFARQNSPDELTALGYEIQTEGILFKLRNLTSSQLSVSVDTAARLRRNFVKHAVVTHLSIRPDINYFAAERFTEVMLSAADIMTHLPGGQAWEPEQLANACRSGVQTLRSAFTGMINAVYHLSRKNCEAVINLFNTPDIRAIFADAYLEIHTGGPRYNQYLEDTFVHTLKHVLKKTAQSLAGVEAMEYVSAYTQLNMDFGELNDRPIWLYELGVGGVGVMRSVQEVLRRQPAHFWRVLETTINACETEAEDLFLLHLLAQPIANLQTLHTQVTQLQSATTSAQRQAALELLRQVARQYCNLQLDRLQIRLLVKLFTDDYTFQGANLRNWQLYRELNVLWVADLSSRLGRLPTHTEARGLLHYELTHSDPQRQAQAEASYPELAKLLTLYRSEYANASDEVRRAFENAIGRRLLLNCRDACPTCLDEGPACQVDPPGLSHLTLSRILVREQLQSIRQARTVTATNAASIVDLAGQVENLFRQDLTSPVVVAASTAQANILAELISYLTDYGIDDRLQPRFPQVIEVRTDGTELRAQLELGDDV